MKSFLSAIAVLAMITSGCAPIETRTARFAEDVKKVIAPEELRQWADEAIAQARVQTNVSWQIEKASVPKEIRGLNSQNSPFQFAFYDTNEQDTNGRIMLCWGGGFGHWGIMVGSTNYVVSEDSSLYTVKWKPGIYFWHETR